MARFRRKKEYPPTVEAMKINNPHWVCGANENCWLVEDEHGCQQVMSDEYFKRRFERV